MAIYAGIFLFGFAAVSFWALWITVRPPRISIGLTPQHYHLPAESITVVAGDGVPLAGWLIPREDASPEAPVVILLHGYPVEKADMLSLALPLHPHFATLLMDLRYFGKSGGRFTTLGLRERDDLRRAIDFLEQRGFTKIGVFGFSLGGAVGLMAAAEDSRIKAVASYAAFSDLKTLGRESYRRLWLLKYPLVELMALWARLLFGGDATAFSPAKAAAELTIPALIVASREDEQISFGHATALRRALERDPQAEFYFFDRGRHGELPSDFDDRLRAFFLRHLR